MIISWRRFWGQLKLWKPMLLGMMSLCMSKTHSSAYGAIETLYQSSFCRLNIPFPLKRQPCDQISTLLHLLSLSKDICPSVIQETASRCPPTIHYMKCHSTHMHISPMYIFPSVMLGIEPVALYTLLSHSANWQSSAAVEWLTAHKAKTVTIWPFTGNKYQEGSGPVLQKEEAAVLS